MSDISPKAGSLSVIIRSYKSAVTRLCGLQGLTEFTWQTRYHDHIIRDENSLFNIRQYIISRSRNNLEEPENRGAGDARTPVFGESFGHLSTTREVLIMNNPAKWEFDQDNSSNGSPGV